MEQKEKGFPGDGLDRYWSIRSQRLYTGVWDFISIHCVNMEEWLRTSRFWQDAWDVSCLY